MNEMSETYRQSRRELVEAASRQAAQQVIDRAIQTNTPVIVWENGEIVKKDPRQIKLPGEISES
jgi:predicted dinucleotide-utilizing enzyme